MIQLTRFCEPCSPLKYIDLSDYSLTSIVPTSFEIPQNTNKRILFLLFFLEQHYLRKINRKNINSSSHLHTKNSDVVITVDLSLHIGGNCCHLILKRNQYKIIWCFAECFHFHLRFKVFSNKISYLFYI